MQGSFVSVSGRTSRLMAGDVDHVTNAQLVRWWNEEQIAVAVCSTLLSLSDGSRILADKFLMSSMLAEFVLQKNRLGIAVSLSSLVEKYLRLWSFRSTAPKVDAWLTKLTHCANARKKFGLHFRQTWAFRYHSLKLCKPLSQQDTNRKVLMWTLV